MRALHLLLALLASAALWGAVTLVAGTALFLAGIYLLLGLGAALLVCGLILLVAGASLLIEVMRERARDGTPTP